MLENLIIIITVWPGYVSIPSFKNQIVVHVVAVKCEHSNDIMDCLLAYHFYGDH